MAEYRSLYALEHDLDLELNKVNLSLTDRLVRVTAGLGMVAIDYASNINWDILLLAVGVWGVMTSAFGFCPFYKLMGHSTCPI
ncbi:MAG: DUF2892 domain-containing protein [Euryarchaeota archaeon TMED99]|nr:MAG: DUF2892 domain-containing protein [Euryarchaeota archaeon TMED99]